MEGCEAGTYGELVEEGKTVTEDLIARLLLDGDCVGVGP